METYSPIVAQTRQLCQSILDDKQFQEIVGHIEFFNQNVHKFPEYLDFLELQGDLEEKRHNGEELTAEDRTAYETAFEKAMSNEDVATFVACQEQLDQLVEMVTGYVNETIDNGTIPEHDEVMSQVGAHHHHHGCGDDCGCEDGSGGCGDDCGCSH